MANESKWISTTTDWGATGSWDDALVPDGVTQVAVFDDVVTDALINLDRGVETLGRIVTTVKYSGNIGAPGNPLKHELDSSGAGDRRIVHRGTGEFHFKGATGGFSDVFVDSRGGSFFADGVIRNMFVRSGTVTVLSTANLTGIIVMDGVHARLIVNAPATSEIRPSIIIVGAGLLENKSAGGSVTFVIGSSGRILQTGKLAASDSIIILGNGLMDYKPIAAQATNPARLVVLGAMNAASHFDLKVVDLIIGSGGVITGPVSQSTPFGPSGVDIDFREEYP